MKRAEYRADLPSVRALVASAGEPVGEPAGGSLAGESRSVGAGLFVGGEAGSGGVSADSARLCAGPGLSGGRLGLTCTDCLVGLSKLSINWLATDLHGGLAGALCLSFGGLSTGSGALSIGTIRLSAINLSASSTCSLR